MSFIVYDTDFCSGFTIVGLVDCQNRKFFVDKIGECIVKEQYYSLVIGPWYFNHLNIYEFIFVFHVDYFFYNSYDHLFTVCLSENLLTYNSFLRNSIVTFSL